MKTTTFFSKPLFLKFLYFAIFACLSSILHAEQSGLFTYEIINGNEVEITDYPKLHFIDYATNSNSIKYL